MKIQINREEVMEAAEALLVGFVGLPILFGFGVAINIGLIKLILWLSS